MTGTQQDAVQDRHMRNIVTWTFLWLMAAFVGFSGMLLITQSSNLAHLLAQEVQAQEGDSAMPRAQSDDGETDAAQSPSPGQAQTGAPATADKQTPIAQLPTGELLNAVGTIE